MSQRPILIVLIGCALLAAVAAVVALARSGHRAAAAQPAVAAHADIDYWTCSMHPSVHSADPGSCPICGMTLIPVHRHAATEEGADLDIAISAPRRQELGIRTEPIAVRALQLELRAPGRVAYDETRLAEVSLKVGGWVTGVSPAAVGSMVAPGEPLFSVYSPEIYAAERELALAAQPGAAGGPELLRAARERLRLWGVAEAQIDALAVAGAEVPRSVDIVAPIAGAVTEKSIVPGSAVTSGQPLYRIADLAQVWVLVDLYQEDLGLIKPGQEATIALTTQPGESLAGRVDLVAPALDPSTRTARARIVLDNPGQHLRPGMFATVAMSVPVGERLQVPKSAVIYTGPRRVVFVDLGGGRLRPREVRLGLAGAESYEVLDGLAAGDVVVTSGNFLVAAESRIRSAETFWKGDDAR